MLSCPQCGPIAAAEHDDSLGHTVCMSCGQVIEENAIVADLSFSEKASGATVADGFSMSKDQSRVKSLGKFGVSAESREKVLENGNRRISQIASAMQMTTRYIESAQRYFNLAVSNNFNKGRRTGNVAAACLYVVCRMEKTSHMLIDFSDVLQTNVYVLGATFLKLVQLLHLNLPLVDPALYIARFAAKLEFEDKTQKVISDSLRLVQRMSRDWIQIGRRPAGICAASLFIAARMNCFKRTHAEIIHVVKICEATLRKRLEEFKETPSGVLTISDFQNVWLEQSANPPAFHQKKRKSVEEKSSILAKENSILLSMIKGTSSSYPVGIEKGSATPLKYKEDHQRSDDSTVHSPATTTVARHSQSPRLSTPSIHSPETLVAHEPADQYELAGMFERHLSREHIPSQLHAESQETLVNDDQTRNQNDEEVVEAQIDKLPEREVEQEEEYDEDKALEEEMQEYLEDEELVKIMNKINQREEGEDLSILDDDEEVQDALLTQDEIDFKSFIWHDENKDWLERQDEKENKKSSSDVQNKRRLAPRKRRKKDHTSFAASNAMEAAKNLVQSKPSLSRKINYAILETILEDPES